jgi:hypothetical protein
MKIRIHDCDMPSDPYSVTDPNLGLTDQKGVIDLTIISDTNKPILIEIEQHPTQGGPFPDHNCWIAFASKALEDQVSGNVVSGDYGPWPDMDVLRDGRDYCFGFSARTHAPAPTSTKSD